MTPERWEHVKELFDAALARSASERRAFLDEACAGDAALREQVEALLASDAQAERFLERPAHEVARRWTAAATTDPVVGQRLGAYRILREIGRGGMGAVYLAERADGAVRKQVAIKLIKRGLDTEAILRRFGHERQILADLDHPNIIRFLDAGTTADGRPYYIMDYVEGLPLDQYGDTHRLSIDQRLQLFRTVCAAVQYAHEHQVIHRDLKPSNILVTADGVPKLLDFGIAKVLDPERSATTDASLAGRAMTPEYASPEQVRGEAVTPASDVYSLGVLLYELLTGHRPYRLKARTPEALAQVIGEQEPEKPSTAISRVEEVSSADGEMPVTITPALVSAGRGDRPDQLRRRLSGDLDNIVLMALRKEPARRYASVTEFSEDIRRHLEGQPVVARPDTRVYRAAKFLRRNTVPVVQAAISVLLLLTVIGLGFYPRIWRPHVTKTPAPVKPLYSVAVLPFKMPDDTAEGPYLGLSMADALITKLSGVSQVVVRPTEEVRSYTKTGRDPLAVGHELGVDILLDGTLERVADQLRVGVYLWRVRDGHTLWAQQLEAPAADFFKIHDFILEQVSWALKLRLNAAEQKRLVYRYTTNLEAWELYMKGWSSSLTIQGRNQSLTYGEAALEKDPNFALAHVGVAGNLWSLYLNFQRSRAETVPRAKTELAKALELDESCARAYYQLAWIQDQADWEWAGAERSFRRAIELWPNHQAPHRNYAAYLVRMGRFEEGWAEAKRAEALPSWGPGAVWVGMNLVLMRRYEEAIGQLQMTLDRGLTDPRIYHDLGRAYLYTGRLEQAIGILQKGRVLDPEHPLILAWLGHMYGVAGQRSEVQRVRTELEQRLRPRAVPEELRFIIHMGLGEKEAAWACLESMYKERSFMLAGLKVDPLYDPLRRESRFQAILRRMNFPP